MPKVNLVLTSRTLAFSGDSDKLSRLYNAAFNHLAIWRSRPYFLNTDCCGIVYDRFLAFKRSRLPYHTQNCKRGRFSALNLLRVQSTVRGAIPGWHERVFHERSIGKASNTGPPGPTCSIAPQVKYRQ